jgi:GTP-binding protein EngB required for normal cell division
MFGITASSLARAACYLRKVNRNICLERSCWSKTLARNWSQFQACHFGNYYDARVYKRWFKLCCCLSDKHEFIRDENKITSEYTDGRITVGSNENTTNLINDSTKMSGNFTTHQGILPHTEFLGIEVFPEIFDQLPPKCTGCGAILQSQNENKPGFIPESRNPNLSWNSEENSFMPEIICTRCFSLKHYNKDAPPLVLPETISNFLTHISRRKALILYVIDVMDIPGSFAEDLLKIVGETKHIILVCNKIDRLPVDGHPRHQIQHVKKIMSDEAMKFGLQNANVRDVSVISAKNGFGILDLVRTINKHWQKNSDMYLVGCNNSGKTTLFNILVDLFTASRHSDNMLQRGSVSPSAGTTLSLLRYPVTKHRFLRLQDRLKSGYSEVRVINTDL